MVNNKKNIGPQVFGLLALLSAGLLVKAALQSAQTHPTNPTDTQRIFHQEAPALGAAPSVSPIPTTKHPTADLKSSPDQKMLKSSPTALSVPPTPLTWEAVNQEATRCQESYLSTKNYDPDKYNRCIEANNASRRPLQEAWENLVKSCRAKYPGPADGGSVNNLRRYMRCVGTIR